jgi:hypothetical protein
MSDDKIFANGFLFKDKNENAPEWVIGKMSIKVDEATEWLNDHADKGWVNIEIKRSQSGKPYMELDTWKPTPQDEPKAAPKAAPAPANGPEEDVPF